MAKQMKKRTKIILATLGVILLGFAGFCVWVATPGDTTELETVANKFQPDPSWQVVSKKVYPERKICIDEPCGSTMYTWSTEEDVTSSQINELSKMAGYDLLIQKECDHSSAPGGTGSTVCSAESVEGDFRIVIDVTASSTEGVLTRVNLRVYDQRVN